MSRKIFWTAAIAAIITLLLPEPASADRLRWRSRVRNFPSNEWCLIGDQQFSFRADSHTAQVTFTANDVQDQRIDNIYVVEREVYENESFLLDPAQDDETFAGCCKFPKVYNFDAEGSTEVFLDKFDDGAIGWKLLNGAQWESAPASGSKAGPRHPAPTLEEPDPDTTGGSLILNPGSSATVTVTGLQPGREYVVGGWWYTELENQVLTIDVETELAGGLSLRDGRFRVEATWSKVQGSSGVARGGRISEEAGFLWFFRPENVELVVKVLDGCHLNSRYWVFIGGLTDVRVVLKVTDRKTGESKTYRNRRGVRFQAIQDTDTFATCP